MPGKPSPPSYLQRPAIRLYSYDQQYLSIITSGYCACTLPVLLYFTGSPRLGYNKVRQLIARSEAIVKDDAEFPPAPPYIPLVLWRRALAFAALKQLGLTIEEIRFVIDDGYDLDMEEED